MARLLTLQAARGVAANLVVISHLSVLARKYAGSTLPDFAFYGIAGVDLFFVLSGFIMVAIAGRNIGAGRFLWRRAVRIYPTYWFVSLVVLAISWAAPALVNSSIQGPISIWRSFLLVPQETLPLLAVGWTLIHEMYFYLAFALLLLLRIPVPTGLAMWAALLVVGALFIPHDRLVSSPTLRVLMSPLTAEFMIGAVVGLLYCHKVVRGARIAGAAGLAALAGAICFAAPVLPLVASANFDAWRVILFGAPCALIIYWLAAAELRSSPRPWPILVRLGDWSYATYLVHVLVVAALARSIEMILPDGVGAAALLVALGLPAANLAGAALFYGFERPVLSKLRTLGPPARGETAPPSIFDDAEMKRRPDPS